MTSWRDLGSGEPFETDPLSSDWAVGPRTRFDPSEKGRGSIFEAFETETGNYRGTRDRWQAAPSKDALNMLWRKKQAEDALFLHASSRS